MVLYKNNIIPNKMVDMDDNEYNSFIHTINDYAEKAAGFRISNYPELETKRLFSYDDLYELAMRIHDKCQDIYIQKGVKLLEYIIALEK